MASAEDISNNRLPNFRPSTKDRERQAEGGGERHNSRGSSKGDGSKGPTFYRGDSSERRKLNQQFYKGAPGPGAMPPQGYMPGHPGGPYPAGAPMMPPPYATGMPGGPYPQGMPGGPYPPQPGAYGRGNSPQGGHPYPPMHPNMMPMMTPQGYYYPPPYGMPPPNMMPPGMMPPGMMPPQQPMTQEQHKLMMETHAAAGSTQGFAHIKLQNLINSKNGRDLATVGDMTTQDAATTKKTGHEDDYDDEGEDSDSDSHVTGTIAKTEAGDGMFGADIELDSLTDSDGEDEKATGGDKKKKGTKTKFQIVAGEDSDSMFEDRLQQDGKFEDMGSYGSEYDDEAWNLDEYNEMNEQAPEALPLETILEENSQMKDSPPQAVPTKAQYTATNTGKARRPTSGTKSSTKTGSKRVISPKRRVVSPARTTKTQTFTKGKTMHQSPSARMYPEMSEHDRKLAESDAFLRKINQTKTHDTARQRRMLMEKRGQVAQLERDYEMSQRSNRASESDFNVDLQTKTHDTAKQRRMLMKKREKVAQLERDHEMSQLSNWTSESTFNVDLKEKEALKRKQKSVLDDIYRTGLPDRENLVDTIVALRQAKNHNDEEVRLLKVSCARLQKQLAVAREHGQSISEAGSTRADWLKQQSETSHTNGTNMIPTDIENSLNDNRKLKRTINGLQEQISYFKVAAEKYQKRAIYVRKKYAQLLSKTKNGGVADGASTGSGNEDKLRLKVSQLQGQIKKHTQTLIDKEGDIAKLKSKVANISQLSKFRLDAEKHAKTCEKLTQRLLVLERNEQKKKQYEEIRRQLQDTMVEVDAENAAQAEQDRLDAEERLRVEEEEAKAKAEADEAQEVQFDPDAAKYQEDNFIARGVPPMGNKDIIEAVGLEYVHVSYEKKPKGKGKGSPGKKTTLDSQEFDDDLVDEGDQALPDDELAGEKDAAGHGRSRQSDDNTSTVSSDKAVSTENPTKNYVAATLNAWNSCPTIVKKQLDKQNEEILELKAKLREADVKVQMKKNDYEKNQATIMKKELMKHRENIENIFKRKLDEEKRKLLKQRVDEVDQLMKENKRLNAKIASKW